jgi:hypothetical protein
VEQRRRSSTAAVAALALAPPVLALAVALACATPRGEAQVEETARLRSALERSFPLSAPAPAPAPPGLRIHLAFGADADLDLYVTDPLQETVYFANTPSRSGGRLVADRHCGESGGDRVEEVLFDDPPPGRYRVSVDYARWCGRSRRPVGFAVGMELRGLGSIEAGAVAPLEFRPVVLEFEVAADGLLLLEPAEAGGRR